VSLLEAIAGSWVSIFGLRKRLLCLMDIIFEPLSIEEKSLVLQLSDEFISELWSLILIGPLSGVNLRAQYASYVTATDASSDWLAAVRAPLEASLVEEFSRRSLKRGAWAQSLSPGKSWLGSQGVLPEENELPSGVYDTHPLWTLLARGLHYSERWRLKVAVPTHINVLEMKSFLREERLISYKQKHVRCLFGLDSQVCLGALCKGRAGSITLNREMRRNVPHILGSDLYSLFMYFPSAVNRADDPTRHSIPRGPDVDLPFWWSGALHGDFSGHDAWIKGVEEDVFKAPFDLTTLKSTFSPLFATARERHDRGLVKRQLRVEEKLSSRPSANLSSRPSTNLSSQPSAKLSSQPEREVVHAHEREYDILATVRECVLAHEGVYNICRCWHLSVLL
jgi:hypothetical protein